MLYRVIWELTSKAETCSPTYPAHAIVREVRAETGLIVRPKRIIGVFGGPGFRYQYPNGDEVEYTVVLFECSPVSSSGGFDGEETAGLEYFPCEQMPALSVRYPDHIFSASDCEATYFET